MEEKGRVFPKYYKLWKFCFVAILVLDLMWIIIMAVTLKEGNRLSLSFKKMDKYEDAEYKRELRENDPLVIAICALVSMGQIFGWIGVVKSNLLLLSVFNRISVTATVAIGCKITIHSSNPVNYIELIFSIPVLFVARKFITKVKIIEVFYSSKL